MRYLQASYEVSERRACKVVKVPRSVQRYRSMANRHELLRARILNLWAYHNQVTLAFSRPGKPTDNGHIESFNGSLRDECLNAHWFSSLADAKDEIAAWLKDYNESRPHRALNNLAPLEYVAQLENGA